MYNNDARHQHAALEKKLRHLYTLRGGPGIDLTIRPAYYELLDRLGNPHKNLPPVIHVAGTNGKGSTIAFLRAALEATGLRVHCYTSPHLLRFNERIVLAGRVIDDEYLETLLDEVTAVNGELPLTFFEITTALAFTAFARIPADIVLLETGLGGRLDCTNVIERPLATIITAIGMDHAEYLGTTLPAIAKEKAGIMKEGIPCIIAPQDSAEIENVFKHHAAQLSVPLYLHDHAWQVTADEADLTLTIGRYTLIVPRPGLVGAHQIRNAGTALAGLRIIPGLDIPEQALAKAMQSAYWPGRLHFLPLASKNNVEVWLDGGHNEQAARALADQAVHWAATSPKPLHLILGMMQTKTPMSFIKPLAPYLASLTALDIPGEDKACPAAQIMDEARALGVAAHSATGLPDALSAVTEGRVLIAGSLYLAGHTLSIYGSAQ